MLTDDQRAMRRTGVTATDMAAILGLSPWKTAFQVWCEKMGGESRATGDDVERGEFLEDGARRWYAHRTGAHVIEPGTMRHPRHAVVLATPDGLVDGPERRVLEIKMPRTAAGWGEEGTDAIPQQYVLQVAVQIAVVAHQGYERADVFAVIGGAPRVYRVVRDLDLEGMLIEAAERFWKDHVEPRKPPPITEPIGDLDAVSALYPKHEGDALEWSALSASTQDLFVRWLRNREAVRHAQEMTARDEAQVRLALGATPQIVGLPDDLGVARIDWKQNKPSTVTDWEAVAEELRASVDVSLKAYMEIVERNTTTKPGARPLRVYERKGE